MAADAGVSPALVVHHFGSKDGLRQACDEYVLDTIRSGDETSAEVLTAATPVCRYLARALLDNAEAAAALFTEIVERTEVWLANGENEGWVRATTDARGRAVTYVSCCWRHWCSATTLAVCWAVTRPRLRRRCVVLERAWRC